jgi:hypothetical protein
MANPITEIFKKKKIEEVVKPVEHKEETINVSNLYTSNKVLINGTDVTSTDEAKLISLYRQMENDAIISAALDLYADNSTQVNQKTGHVVAIESADKTFQDEINEFLWKIVRIDHEAWQIVRDIARDGKIFLDTKAFNNGREWSFVPVENPALVKALTFGQDQVKYFVVSPEVQEDDDSVVSRSFKYMYNKTQDPSGYIVEPSDRFISGFNTREITGKMSIVTNSLLDGSEITEELKIRSGRSILAPVIQTWQTLSSLEDSLYINRLTKSTEFKLVQIDVSDSNNKQAEQIINAVKDAFKNSEAIDQMTNRYQNRQSPIPINDFVYVPVKGTKGAVTISAVGGDVGTINLADIDYFRNKLFAGLGVLKAYLGFEETTPGGLGDATLTKLDERLGRRIIRLQQVLKHVVYSIVEYYWKHSTVDRTKEQMPDFNIILGKVSTKEEEEDKARIKDSIEIANSIISLAKDEAFNEFVSNERLFKYIFEDIIGIDTKAFDNSPSEDEISLKVKQVKNLLLTETFDHTKNKKFKTFKEENEEIFITGKIEKLLDSNAMHKLEHMLEEYDIYLESLDGKIKPLHEVFSLRQFKKLFTEKTYAQLKDMSKKKDPLRLNKSKKLVAKYSGLDKDNNIVFQITAENPEKNKAEGKPTSYQTKVALKDLSYLMQSNIEDETAMDEKDITQMAIQGDVSVSCECPAAKWWGQQYNGTIDDYSLTKNTIAPTVRIPTQVLCKHTILMLTVLPFWYNTIIRDLKQKGMFKELSKKTVKKDNIKEEEQE